MLTFRVFGLFAGFLVAAFLSIALVHNFTQKQEMEQRWNVCENMVQKFVATNRADLKRATDDATHTRTIMGQELQVISNALEENTRKVIENQKLLEQKDQELISKKSIIERLEAESSAANKTNSEMATKLSSLELTVPKMESELKDCKLKTQAPTTAVIPRFYGSHGVDNFVFTKYFQQFGEVKGKYVEINAGDGIQYSTSRYFEDTLKWDGLLTESKPSLYQKLIQNRPGSHTVNVVVNVDEKDVTVENKSIASLPLSTLLKLHSLAHIDYLSIRGNSLPVLESIDWDDHVVYVISVEVDQEAFRIKEFLNRIGFGRDTRFESTSIQVWANKENKPL